MKVRGFRMGVTLVLAGALCLGSVQAQDAAPAAAANGGHDLTAVSLESLMGLNVVVTSASKKAESLRDATSAIFVITQDDIRHSGFKTIPDLLSMVPGVQVARQSGDEWAVSARGFNSNYNNKMLVLVDGRSVYDPVLGGVNWDEQGVILEDIDHIEVIRGPGGTLWGSNAVNGVINIITKDAKLTQGLYVSALGGANLYKNGVSSPTALNGQGEARYGGQLGGDLYYRVYGKADNQNPFENPDQGTAEQALNGPWHDGSYDFQAGFRGDLHQDSDQWTFEGAAEQGHFDYTRLNTTASPIFDPITFTNVNDINTDIDQNAHLLAGWTKDFNDDSEIQAQGYYDFNHLTTSNDDRLSDVGQADLQFQHRFHLGDVNEITWGGSWHNDTVRFANPLNWYYVPQNQTVNIYSGFLQDRLTLERDRWSLTVGTKLENNPYTGNEWQPSARLLFTPNEKDSFWGAVSKAVRIPTLSAETGYVYLAGVPAGTFGPGSPAENTYGALVPNPDLKAENLVSYELGYRTNPTKETSIDLASFYNHYEQLINIPIVPGSFSSPAGGVISEGGYGLPVLQEQNTGTGDIWGLELSATWNPSAQWRAALSYSYQDYDQAMIQASSTNLGGPPPHNLASLRLAYTPVTGLSFNGEIYYTDATFLYDLSTDDGSITPDYVRLNLGADWKATDNLELALEGLDLEGAHSETLQAYGISPVQVVPSFYAQATLRY